MSDDSASVRAAFEASLELVRSIGACLSTHPSPSMITTAASTVNDGYSARLMRAVRAEYRQFREGSDCDPDHQPYFDISAMRALPKTLGGIVYYFRYNEIPLVFKWAPIEHMSDMAQPSSETAVENVVSCAATAVRMSGRVPFFTATFCTFGCRIDNNRIVQPPSSHASTGLFHHLTRELFKVSSSKMSLLSSSSSVGLASLQEFIPYSLEEAQSMCGFNIMSHAGMLTLTLSAVYFMNEIMHINHNDLHIGNVRFKEVPGGKMGVRWNGVWRMVSSPFMPMIIDWGRACEYADGGVCSNTSRNMYRREGRPVTPNGDLTHLVSRMVGPLSDKFVPPHERAVKHLSVFSHALQIVCGTTHMDRRMITPQMIAASLAMATLFLCCISHVRRDGSIETPLQTFGMYESHVFFHSNPYYEYMIRGPHARDRRPFIFGRAKMFMDSFMKLWPRLSQRPPHVVCAILS